MAILFAQKTRVTVYSILHSDHGINSARDPSSLKLDIRLTIGTQCPLNHETAIPSSSRPRSYLVFPQRPGLIPEGLHQPF